MLDSLIASFADTVIGSLGEIGYAILLWIINLLLNFQVA